MKHIIDDIDDILSDLDRLPQPDYSKVSRQRIKRMLQSFLETPLAILALTAMQCLLKCTRCGECCRYSNPISLDNKECNVIAKYLGMTNRSFKEKYIRELRVPNKRGVDKGDIVIKKNTEEHCPFYNNEKGCNIYAVRPAACIMCPYLEENILDGSEYKKSMPCIIHCPASVELDNKVRAFSRELRADPEVYAYATSKLNNLDNMLIYVLNMFIRGIAINDGPDIAQALLDKLGMPRMATDKELDRVSLLFCGVSIDYPDSQYPA